MDVDRLTPRELQVAHLIAEGWTNQEAANKLKVSHHAIHSHLRIIFHKLQLHNRVALTRWVLANGSKRR